MKILMIYDSYGYYGGDLTYINNLNKGLRKKGHEVFNISLSNEISLEKEHLIDVKTRI